MRELYARLLEDGEAGIDQLIAKGMQESLQLDFKRKEVDRNGEFSTNDRRMLAEALSGFANSAGGLLIVGVDARPGADKVDCAQEARPIGDIRRFLADANTEVGRLVQPRLDGVSIAAVPSERVPGSGYLLVHVERSQRRPHRSEAKGQKGYYKRFGDSFFEMEHYDIEDAFSRAASANISLNYTIHKYIKNPEQQIFLVILTLENTSDVIAKRPYVIFSKMNSIGVQRPDPSTGIRLISANGLHSVVGGQDNVIHPKMIVRFAELSVEIVRPAGGHSSWQFGSSETDGERASIDLTFGCEGSRGQDMSLNFQVPDFDI